MAAKLLTYLIMILTAVSLVSAITNNIPSFNNQPNPFYYEFIAENNLSSYILIPKYADLNHLTLRFRATIGKESIFNISENATKTHIGGGWVDPVNLTDGNYSTYTLATGGSYSYFEVNYTKSVGAAAAIWEVKDSNGIHNISIPSYCFDLYPDKLVLQVYSLAAGWYWEYSCNKMFTLEYLASPSRNFWEERIYWLNSSIENNITISTANTINSTGIILNSTQNFDLNITAINQSKTSCSCNNCISSNKDCYIPISITLNRSLNTTVSLIANYSYNPYMNYTQYKTYSSNDYVYNLSYNSYVVCNSNTNTYLERYINGTKSKSTLLPCNNRTITFTDTFIYTEDKPYNISFYYNSTQTTFYGNHTFISDITAPVVKINYTLNNTGFGNAVGNITLRCIDAASPLLFYNKTYNGVNFFEGNLTNNTLQSNQTTFINGVNNLTGVCKDFFWSSTVSSPFDIYTTNIYLIDEKENAAFNLDNVTSAIAYFDDNSTSYDFKTTGKTAINFSTSANNKLRFEFIYEGGVTVIRYIDVSLLTNDLRVCINKEGTTHYEQLITSAIEQPAVLKNVFSNCIVAADYTRFAYQDTKVLKAYTINSLYYLYNFDETTQTFLASLDGSIQTYINLDTLKFQGEGYNINILNDALSFSKSDDTTVQIHYDNQDTDNQDLDLTITNMDTNDIVLTLGADDFTDYNEFTVYFNYATLDDVNDTTLFKLDLVKTNAEGLTETITRFFTTAARSGALSNGVAFIIAVLLTVFGLTFTATRITFSWFGIIILLGSIIIMSFAAGAWYLTLFQVIDVIVLVYAIIIMTTSNYPTVS